MLLDGAFRALLLPPLLLLLLVVISGSSSVIVPPPTNLSVSCKNLNVIASWEFSRQQPPTVFSVHIGRTVVSSVINTTDHQYNLTRYIWPDEISYMDNFYVTVTAVQGSSQSEPVQSKTFSFNTMKTTDITCKLDFPPVDLKWTDSGATVSFRNPFHVYSLRADDPSTAEVVFKASTNPSVGSSKIYSNKWKCTAKEEICKLDVSFPDGVEKCVTLDGTLSDSKNVGEIEFGKVERICVDKPAEDLLVLLAVLMSIVVLIIGVIIVCVCLTRAWTMETGKDLPRPLVLDPAKQDPKYNIVSDPDIAVITLTGNHLKEKGKSTENLQDGGFCSDSEGGFLASSKQEEATRLIYEENGMDDDSADSSVKTECISLQPDELEEEEQQEVEEEVELVPDYDRPHNLQMDNERVDLGDGEMATGYRGR